MALLLTRYGGLGLPQPRQTFEAHSSTTFENVRVEAREFRSATVRWEYTGASPIEVYRSTDGSIYTLIATVAATVTEYEDTGLADETLYYYKISDDSGTTFSVPVFVVTYVSLSNRVVNQTSHSLPTQPSWFPLVEAQEAHARNNDSENPCILCSHNQALVVNCSTECTAYRIILTEDINSISFVGCDSFICPTVEFITPPGETYGVCGWPVGCDYVGDECFDSPTFGGDVGTSAWSNGLKFPAPAGDTMQDPACPCPPTAALSIKCCDEDCDMSCGEQETVRIKACGGIRPYSWSGTGDVTLSSATGDAITVKRNFVQGDAVFPGDPAFYVPYICHFYDECDPGGCTPPKVDIDVVGGPVIRAYGCDGGFLEEVAPTGGNHPLGPLPYSNQRWTIDPDEIDNCSSVNQNLAFPDGATPISAVFYEACCNAGGKVDWTYTVATAGVNCVNGVVWSGAQPFSGTATDKIKNATCNVPNVCTEVAWDETPGRIDVRTQAMIDGGCSPCDSAPVTITLTDGMGRTVTVILAT